MLARVPPLGTPRLPPLPPVHPLSHPQHLSTCHSNNNSSSSHLNHSHNQPHHSHNHNHNHSIQDTRTTVPVWVFSFIFIVVVVVAASLALYIHAGKCVCCQNVPKCSGFLPTDVKPCIHYIFLYIPVFVNFCKYTDEYCTLVIHIFGIICLG